ncbi:MAG: RNA 2',3'-cyclic phosphodiesterase [Acidobacteriaceae bacterium]
MRLFTAIPLPASLKQAATEVFRGRLSVPYINTSNLHVTLNFFGELTDEEVERVKLIFQETMTGQKGFPIEFDRVTQFRQQIHITLRPNEPLKSLQATLNRAFIAAGFDMQERIYYPHVKLTNLHMDKIMHPERKLEHFPNQELKKLDFLATSAVLYESKLLLHHAQHIPLIEAKLI